MRRSALLLLFVLLTAAPALAGAFFHEASCPAVDTAHMTRIKRSAALAGGTAAGTRLPSGAAFRRAAAMAPP
jgi:hypothetical protein